MRDLNTNSKKIMREVNETPMATHSLKEMVKDRGSLTHKQWFDKYPVKQQVASKMPACKGGNCTNKAHRHTR